METQRHLIIRVDLNREVTLGINKLDEQGEAVTIAAIHVLAHQVGTIAQHQLRKRQPLVRTLGHHRLMSRHGRKFPTLTNGFIASRQPFKSQQFVTAPQDGLQDAIELIYLHFGCN